MKLRWLALALLSGLAVPFIVPALAAQDHAVTVGPGSSYTPTPLNVAVGDKVIWTNEGGGLHNVKFADGSFEDPPSPDTSNWSVNRTFDSDATLVYFCEYHGGPTFGMRGTIVVGNGGSMTGTTGTGTGTAPGDTSRPSISSLEGSSSFCRRRSRTCRRPGLRFRLELSEPATLEGVVTRTGKLRGAATRKTFARSGRQGVNNIKVSARGLAKGRYRLRLTARDAAGNVSPAGVKRFALK